MATFSKRRNGDGSTSWDALVRVVGYPAIGRSFPTKLAAELWAARTEAARRGRTVASARGMTLGHLIDDALPRLTNPTTAIFAYWREELGDVRLDRITPEQIALHRDRLLGADCRGYNHKTSKPRSPATVRNYLIELSRLFALAVKEMRVMDNNPCAAVTKPRASDEVVRWLSDDERTALLAACKASDSNGEYLPIAVSLVRPAQSPHGLGWGVFVCNPCSRLVDPKSSANSAQLRRRFNNPLCPRSIPRSPYRQTNLLQQFAITIESRPASI